jgi:hypothetical protein
MKAKSITLIIAILFSIIPHDAFCKWEDKSEDLPGFLNPKVLIVLGVVATGAIVLLFVKKSKKAKESTSEKSSSISFYNKMKSASEQSRVQLFVGNSNFKSQLNYSSNSRSSVGLRIRF